MSLGVEVERGYAAQAPALIAQYDAVPSDSIYAGVKDLFPAAPVRVLDVGSGSGRDTEWFAALGHDVTAVDPVAAFVAETMRRAPAATISRDRLPGLRTVRGRYDLILVNAVWQHVEPGDRLAALARLAGLLAAGGRMVLSLRHGLGHPARPVAEIDTEATLAQADALGLTLLRRREKQSLQEGNRAADVTWTWLVFERGEAA
ncbi:bifunctional 2-polyprenyl-6-hydroxyphenol methylase/3-demethylubiquinol 3-O-methyltransferase UbiG [uncultured Tateyamaria sp.]|uniref:class I SAM-dependent methyltransferase n=1 Tax=uncultured Tateyamaria sp. TaxID=455651 RepID=UPI002617A592|nr:class I SAM-dependent methyltransferase [uncultured Tateyamaria sp.]